MLTITRNGQTLASDILTEELAGIMAQALANSGLNNVRVESDDYTTAYYAA